MPMTGGAGTSARDLGDAIVRTVTGPMWHGPALDEVLRGVTHQQAAARPIPAGHTIWELVAHLTTWAEVPRARLAGQPRTDVGADEDWPRPPTPSAAAWTDALERLREAHRALAQAVRVLDDAALEQTVPGHDYTVRTMLHGVIEHGTYHGGQIALLRKAIG
jgi:uncharacterized damage-inducible protein DinB